MTKTAEVFRENDRVNHPNFGAGTIKQTDSQYTTIVFDDHGPKKFLTQLVRLERSDVPAREKPVRTAKAPISKTAK
jgi:hypothetical protein